MCSQKKYKLPLLLLCYPNKKTKYRQNIITKNELLKLFCGQNHVVNHTAQDLRSTDQN